MWGQNFKNYVVQGQQRIYVSLCVIDVTLRQERVAHH